MSVNQFTHEQIVSQARFSDEDLAEIRKRRRDNNRLGFAYHLAFVRLVNRFPAQQPLEIIEALLTYVSVQLDIPVEVITTYEQRQQTMAEHRAVLLAYLRLRRLEEEETGQLEAFLFEEACRLEHTASLLVLAKAFLKENGILFPADSTLRRLIGSQRQAAQEHIHKRIAQALSPEMRQKLDALLVASDNRFTPFHTLKRPPRQPSPRSMLRLADKLTPIEDTGILELDLSWLNNNYQRALSRRAQRYAADRMRALKEARRYATLVCFLRQVYQDTIDHMIDMHDKLMLKVENRAQEDVDAEMRRQRRLIRRSLRSFEKLGDIVLGDTVPDGEVREAIFREVDRERLSEQVTATRTLLDGKYSHAFNLVVQCFYYLRQFSPAFLESLAFRQEEGAAASLVEAVRLLQEMNEAGKRKLPEDAPLGFIPRKLRPLVEQEGEVSKHAWECALLLAIRDEIRAGNLYVRDSKRFGPFDNFFIADSRWRAQREAFFKRAGLPADAADVPDYLTRRLNGAFDRFLEGLPENSYASVDEEGWQ